MKLFGATSSKKVAPTNQCSTVKVKNLAASLRASSFIFWINDLANEVVDLAGSWLAFLHLRQLLIAMQRKRQNAQPRGSECPNLAFMRNRKCAFIRRNSVRVWNRSTNGACCSNESYSFLIVEWRFNPMNYRRHE